MRRPAAVILGTFTGAVLMIAAKVGTPPLLGADAVAEATVDELPGPSSGAGGSPDPSVAPGRTGAPQPSGEPQPGATRTGATPGDGETATTTAAAPPAAGLSDGTFAGSAITHKYGTLQISVVVSAGKISDVRWVYTTSSPLSKNINADALPKLRSEALAIQSAQVHTVSGATYTSNAYRTSLQSAIDKAT